MSNVISSARPYAKALYAKAKKDNRIAAVLLWLEPMALVVVDKTVAGLLSDPRVGAEKIIDACIPALGDKVVASDKNFLHLLAENKRMALLPAILALYQQLQLAQLNKVAVEVISSKPLTEAQSLALQKTLEQKHRGPVDLSYRVDSSLLGGLVLRCGDMVIDGSIKSQLHQLSQSINEYA
ncbi:MAG: atpH [Gammaproteobacteria bacterium]|nr:atpH [Gammaproteobacteria bacterium]